MNQPAEDNPEPPLRRVQIGWWLGLLLSAAVIAYAEWDRWSSSESEDSVDRAFDMLFSFNVDSTPFALLLLVLPICWLTRRDVLERTPRWVERVSAWLAETPQCGQRGSRLRAAMFAVLVGFAAFGSCVRVSNLKVSESRDTSFGELPPAFHDEYSYLFQARTFQAGHWSYPSHPEVPRVFDQMHVLNEGQFASRYFPGTGLWIAPFEAAGNPHLGHWMATVIACVCVFATGRELACNGVGLLAGLLAAASPGISLFGNLLLAHQPTLAALGLFVFAFLRILRSSLLRCSPSPDSDPEGDEAECRPTMGVAFVWAALSGIGLAFAMLCRPMTAAAVGLPFGVWLAVWMVRRGRLERRLAVTVVAGFALPLAAGFGVVLMQNQAITGDPFRSPYQQYTDLFTPSHMYGFNNVARGKPLQNERVIRHYDDWAENLDASLAMTNVQNRWLASWQWTLGLVPLLVTGCVLLIGGARNLDTRWWLLVAAIGSLHLLHVPYWYDGIMHWHYVFESGVLWCLLAAAGTLLLFRLFRKLGRPWMSVWWSAVLLAAVAVNHVAMPPFWGLSRLDAGISELGFARMRFEEFHEVIASGVNKTPALVLISHNPDDRHIDYVSNSPDLTGPILFGRVPADSQSTFDETLRAAALAYMERSLYVAIAPRQTGQPWQLRRLR